VIQTETRGMSGNSRVGELSCAEKFILKNIKGLVAVRTLRQYWEEFFTARRMSSKLEGQPVSSPEVLEREIPAIGSEIQELVDEVHRLRSDVERFRDQENSTSPELDLINSRFETAREAVNRNTHTILDLEARLAGLESERDQARDKGRGLENFLPGTSDRMEITDKYVRDLEARLTGLESERDQVRDKVGVLENSVSNASDRMETTNNHVRDLEDRLKSKHEDYQNTFQGMLMRFRKQDSRTNRTMFFAAIALLLGAVSVVILVWDVQKNAALHSSMRKELKELSGSIEGRLSLQHNHQEEKQQLILPETPHSAPGEKAAAKPEKLNYSKKPRYKIDNAYPPDNLIDLLNQ